ncbi:MADS-box transcription factor PHERES 2-like [Andrographis paniculata]|uniref:MADS-box transcription factor PHERES 2-like n=1 Tax=Andrographis paniculata TaxID=175694 RepID=UPI0021E7FA18|nr:MADS-box transcription factor PHERES 2-like [Andrographis paniculata]
MERIKHEQLTNENKRNSILLEETEGLLKEVEQLKILYGVDIAIIGHEEGGESNTILWPSPEGVAEQVNKFMELPIDEKTKRMVTHESYIEQIIKSEKENIDKLMRAMAVKEGHQLLAKKEVEDMDVTELKNLKVMVAEMIKKLKKRAEELDLVTAPKANIGAGSVEGGGDLFQDHDFFEHWGTSFWSSDSYIR